MITTFVVEGTIRGKDRPRMNTKTGNIHTTCRTAGYEQWIRDCYRLRSGHQEIIFKNQVTATIEAYYEIPKSKTKAAKELMRSGSLSPTVKPDVDNIAKVILDALNGLAYADDKQVTTLIVKKFYADEPFVKVILEGEI